MSFIRQGLNKRNLEYWEKDIFIRLHKQTKEIAKLNAYRVCGEQEIDLLKTRIIKLEKHLKTNK